MATQKKRSKASTTKPASAAKVPAKKAPAKKAPAKKAPARKAAVKQAPAKKAAAQKPAAKKPVVRPARPKPQKRPPGRRDLPPTPCDFPPSWLLGTLVTDPVPGVLLPDGRFFALDDLFNNNKIVGLCLGVNRISPPGGGDPRVAQANALGDYLKSAGVFVQNVGLNEEIPQQSNVQQKYDGTEGEDK